MAAPRQPSDDTLTQELFTKARRSMHLLENSPDMFLIGNGNVIEYESASVLKTLGRSLLGPVNFSTLTHPDDVERVSERAKSSIDASMASGKPASKNVEMRVRTSSGSYIWIDSSFAFCGTRFCAVWRNISSAKKAERCLHDFLNTTSHDARTPLSSIKVACELLQTSNTFVAGEDAKDLLSAITASSRVLLAIVHNVMLKQRLDNGECDVSSAPVDIRALAADVVRTARVGLAAQSGTCIELDADAGGDDAAHAAPLPPVIHSSAEHLELLLLNLTVFCVRAAEGAPVQVRLRCEKGEEGGVDAPQRLRLLLEVCACGHALSAEQVGAIFEPYMQDNKSEPGLRASPSQSHLGLHVSRRLVEALGGQLTVSSTEPHGMCFTACIPVSETASPSAQSVSLTPPVDVEMDSDPDDPGIRHLFPPDALVSASFAELRDAGRLPELFDLLLSNTDDGFYMGDNDTFRYASPGLLRLLQYEGEEAKQELLRVPIRTFLHPEELPSVMAAWQAAKAESATRGGAGASAAYTHRLRRRDGSYVWIEAISVQTPTRFYGILRNIDDRKALELSLKEFLISTMSDFRQPLTGIAAASELLARQPCVRRDEEAAFLVAAIAAAARMLSGIVANVLSLRSLEAGDCDVVDAPFSVRDCVAGVLSVCRMSHAHGSGAAIRWLDEDAPLPARVRGDADRLAQILLNLLSNAIKFADGTDVVVSVRCEAVHAEEEGAAAGAAAAEAAPAARLTLRVTDGGRGMTAEERDRAFESYVRAPTHKGGGTGLGLYICKRFAKAMGGSISVETAPGRGACFTVCVPVRIVEAEEPATLPLRQPPAGGKRPRFDAASAPRQPKGDAAGGAAALLPPLPAAASAPSAPRSPQSRCRVLLVDDHGLNLRLCQRLLETAGGLQVVTADDGDVALRTLIHSYDAEHGGVPVDIVLMDMQMPRMDGLAATRAFRAWERRERPPPARRLPIVALSANVFDEKIAECTAAGMQGFLSKPLRLEALRDVLAAQGLA